MFEEIFTPDEQDERTRHEQTRLEQIFIAGNASVLVPAHLNSALQDFTEAVQWDDNKAIIGHLERLIPEFKRTKMEMAAVNTAS